MNVLAFDTSTPFATYALSRDRQMLATHISQPGRNHSSRIVETIGQMLQKSGMELKDIDLVVSGGGPGAFTGLRVGLAAAKALAYGLGVKFKGISSLAACAMNAPASITTEPKESSAFLVCPLLDARKKQVYTALYKKNNDDLTQVTGEMAMAPEKLLSQLTGLMQPVYCLGTGLTEYLPRFEELKGRSNILFDLDLPQIPRAEKMILLALADVDNDRFDDPKTFNPRYLRKSDAELNLLNVQNHGD